MVAEGKSGFSGQADTKINHHFCLEQMVKNKQIHICMYKQVFNNNRFNSISQCIKGLPRWFSGKEPTCNAGAAGDMSSILGSGRSLGGGHSNPLQCSCLENPMDRGACWATVHGVEKSQALLK